ncbi:MAG: hypothetical protein HYR56_11985 [Acidobacteria bacterium]|nr:hypothetical protein [Acidobacteriota bacterium]MBI3422913.1 hypothetical protein [Acidobacteriota bacterium]
MSSFTTRTNTLSTPALDPTKHVNFQLGMVLGADDFEQEFAYQNGRDQWLARDLLGYGTIAGLRVTSEVDATQGPRLVVERGTALSPRGQLLRVPTAQCAALNDWLQLDAISTELQNRNTGGDTVAAYVVLCYRECLSDPVPIAGEPCRSEEDLLVPSRRTDDFQLELRLVKPAQQEEQAVRDFVDWLHDEIEVVTTGASVDLQVFLDAVRAATVGSPPAAHKIHQDDLCHYLREAMRVWATELRPQRRPDWFGQGRGCAGQTVTPDDQFEDCLLLAAVNLPILKSGAQWQVGAPAQIVIDESERPYLIHLRLLQEMLLCARAPVTPPPVLAGDVVGPVSATTVTALQGQPLAKTAPKVKQVLQFGHGVWEPRDLPAAPSPATTVVKEKDFDLPDFAGSVTQYSPADHTHGTMPNPIPPHVGNPNAHDLKGDLSGVVGSATVTGLQNFPVVQPSAADAGRVLTFRNKQWQLEPVTGGGNPNAVEHPADLPGYEIVAAGRVLCNPAARNPFPVYNNLHVLRVDNGEAVFTFDNMQLPDKSSQYIVKVLLGLNNVGNVPFPMFIYFRDFKNEPVTTGLPAFSLGFMDSQQKPIAKDVLNISVLMIEVSRFAI